MSTDTPLDDCGCCDGTPAETPVDLANPPGQSRLAYRVGTHARFKHAMLAAISRSPALAGLQSRADDDPAIAWLDGVAMLLDVLAFYNERIANEGFLATATERRSVLELARAIGYELNPGVAASTFLAFSMETAPGAPATLQLAAGTKAQSIPGQDEAAQTFETSVAVEARPAWNRLLPQLTQRRAFQQHDTSIDVAGTDANLKPGDVLLFVGNERAGSTASLQYDVRRISALDLDAKAGRTRVHWRPPLQHGSLADGKLFVMRARAALFGHNAQPWSALPAALRVGERVATSATATTFVAGIHAGRSASWADAAFAAGRSTLDLDSVVDGLAAGADQWLVLGRADGTFRPFGITSVAEPSTADFNLAGKVTQLGISGVDVQLYAPRSASVFLKSERLPLAETPITAPLPANGWVLASAVAGLKSGQWVAITDQELDGAGNPVGTATSGVVRIAAVDSVGGLTRLQFDRDLQPGYRRAWTTLNANVAPATHGETRSEILGSGDASKPLQQFVLKQKPLTRITTTAAAASGATSTLAIRVDGILWHERPALYGAPADAALFVTRLDDDGSVRVTFGDGERGRRLPTGVENVEARYRVGTGLSGMVRARQISLLGSRPLGLKEVVNPLPPSGAQDPEVLADARAHAPSTVLTLDRVVSLSDFEATARSFGGIAKARAAWLWDRESRVVHLTLAAPKGGAVDPLGPTAALLRAAVDARRHSKIGLRLGTAVERQFVLDAGLRVEPDFDRDAVHAAVGKAVVATFSFERQEFAVSLPASRVVSVMQQVPGVLAVDLNLLHFVGQPARLEPLLRARPARWEAGVIAAAEIVTADPGALTLGEMP